MWVSYIMDLALYTVMWRVEVEHLKYNGWNMKNKDELVGLGDKMIPVLVTSSIAVYKLLDRIFH